MLDVTRQGRRVDRGAPKTTPRAAALAAAICLAFAEHAAAETAEDEAMAEAAKPANKAEEEAKRQSDDDRDDAAYDSVEEVVVTGSRLKRNVYTSISPLQIIAADVKREAGLVDAAAILQESTTASGLQYDLTFEGFVLRDGPGTVTANLRGLGPSRTLVLINGRRVAPAGVEGVPTTPDLAVIPGILVQQYDQLLSGASSVYGSDAVAGVINAILKKDFDGFTVDAFARVAQHGAGREETHALTWGHNGDRGFVGVGLEYTNNEAVTLDDRPWTAGCERHYEIDQNGVIRNRDVSYSTRFNMRWDDDCTLGYPAGIVITANAGWLYHTPGRSNGGWPNFSDAFESKWGGFGYVATGDDGYTDISLRDYSRNGRMQYQNLFSPRTTTKTMAYGEYTLEGESNLTPYFELLWTGLDYSTNGGELPIYIDVPPRNPFNICNPEAEGGVDCGLARDALWTSPGFERQFANHFEYYCAPRNIAPERCTPSGFGLRTGALGAIKTQPYFVVSGDRSIVMRSTSSWRGVVGLSADLPFLNKGPLADWSFDVSLTHSLADSTSVRPGVREDRLKLALGYYSTTDTPCENNIDEATRAKLRLDELPADAAPGCVPVNLFAESIHANVVGDFATAAERDYVFDNRDFRTKYIQSVYSAFLTGTLFEMRAGAVQAVLGFDYRKDEIESIPDAVARDGLLIGFFSDGGAVGDKVIQEFYGEVELPLVADHVGAREIVLNLSGRWTDDEYYGGAPTGAVKLGWRPVESLLIRATLGTSYRSPNLRELFLRGQSGFNLLYDPCFIPEEAYGGADVLGGQLSYQADLDKRPPHVLERCRAQGVDPTLAWANGATSFWTEVSAGGSLGLDEETSESKSFGFSWAQPLTNAFDLNIAMTYYDIVIKNTIIEPSAGYIVWDCYRSQISAGTFCDRITRDLTNPTNPRMTFIAKGFINRDRETVRGVDLNVAFNHTFTILDRPVDVGLDITGHRLIERTTLQINDAGERDFRRYHNYIGYAEHKAEFRLRADYDRWRLAWNTRYIGNYQPWPGTEAPFGNIYKTKAEFASTCLGPPTDSNCKNVESLGDYWLHNASVRYRGDVWSLTGGLRNVFDRAPPKLSPGEYWSLTNNVPRGLGYDLNGRAYFLDVTYSFGREG